MAREIRTTKSGVVLVNKPVGMSSNKAVNIVRFALGAKKCGHLGTLDLEGQGLLPVTVNNATKLFDYFLNKDKSYETVFVFGFETDTLDTSGQILKQKACDISKDEIELACKSFIGKYMQMPPQYSAKKVGGQSAYKSARKGQFVELQPKQVEIYAFKLLEKIEKNTYRFSVSCSSGTYIRSLCRDLAERLDTYGSMQCIIRTRCGGFVLEDAFTIQQIENGDFNMISPETVFDYPELKLSNEECEKLYNGQKINKAEKNGNFKLFSGEDFLGIGQVENGSLCFKLRLF